MAQKKRDGLVLCGFCVLLLVVEGAQARFLTRRQARSTPRGRLACLPSSTLGTRYPDPFALGRHSYRFSLSERNGIVYTCRGGHIDITHVRKLVDWTGYLAYQTREALLENRAQFSYRMKEPSVYHVRIEYPDAWKELPASTREEIAGKVAIEVGQYLAYTGSTWHEILTWFGFKAIGIWPEYTSAFSWEDNYSNVLGTRIAAAALQDPERKFCDAVTALLDAELRTLGVQPKPMAHRAGQAVRGSWFTGDLFSCAIIKRHFDIGIDDGVITPWLVPGLAQCEGAAVLEYPAPTLTTTQDHGFSLRVEIEPREWERTNVFGILRRAGEDVERIEPTRHFAPILAFIRTQAVERYGPFVDDCRIPSDAQSPVGASETTESEDLTTLAERWLSEGTS